MIILLILIHSWYSCNLQYNNFLVCMYAKTFFDLIALILLGPAALGRPAGCQVTEINFFTYKHVRTHTQHNTHNTNNTHKKNKKIIINKKKIIKK